jgi:hypothetical protein
MIQIERAGVRINHVKMARRKLPVSRAESEGTRRETL